MGERKRGGEGDRESEGGESLSERGGALSNWPAMLELNITTD